MPRRTSSLTPTPTVRRKLAFGAVALILGSVFALLAVEIVLRVLGSAPEPVAANGGYSIEPDDGFFVYSDRRGYEYGPGEFTVTFDSGYQFQITHDAGGLRVTPQVADAPEVWILGGSFTHGWSVNDDETFPSVLAGVLPELQVRNLGVGGYGTLLSLIQLEEALEEREVPQTVVLTYGSFHDERNVWTRSWRAAIAPDDPDKGHPIPRARPSDDGFEIVREVPRYRPFPLSGSSAVMSLVEDKAGRVENRLSLHSRQVTEQILLAMKNRCTEAGARFIVAGILDNAATRERLAFCADAGIDTVDISVDLDQGFRNLPHDEHPGPAAHEHYARRLAGRFR